MLVDKDKFTRIRAALTKSLPIWCDVNTISGDAQPTPGQFPGLARVRPIFNDGMSSGEKSWMSASNASFMSMDFSIGQDDKYFTNTSKVNHTFSYAEILLPTSPITCAYEYPPGQQPKHHSDDDGKEVISEITTGRSEIETAQRAEIERLKAIHNAEREALRKIIEEQTAEIQRLKDTQSQESQNNKEATEALRQKNQIQDKATHQIRVDAQQTNMELQQMRLELQAMMNQLLKVLPTSTLSLPPTSTTSSKRTSKNAQGEDIHQDKRINNQTTPAKKKLVFNEVDLSDQNPHDSAMDAEDATESV